jgi:hypothetical protein
MYRLHLTRNLRSLVFLLLAAVIPVAAAALWWANRTGLPDSWRAAIERGLGNEGLHVRVGALSYLPLRGVMATGVRVYSDAGRQHEISRLERVLMDFDKTKLARGDFHLNKIELRNATLTLPVDPGDPAAGTLDISDAHGTLLMPGKRRFEIRDARGFISGIEVSLNARLTGYRNEGDAAAGASAAGKRRRLLTRIVSELDQWHFEAANPPRVRVFLEADSNDKAALAASMTVEARNVEKNGHRLESLSAAMELTGDLLTVTRLSATDSRGALEARVDFDIGDRDGRFDLDSTLEVAPLLAAWFGFTLPGQIVIGGSQTLEAEGEFLVDAENKARVHMTGHLCTEALMLRGVLFDTAESAFAWRDGKLFLRGARLEHQEGETTGKAMIEWPSVRIALRSSLPARVYKPFFIGQPLERVIDDFGERKGAAFDVRLEGGFDATDRHSWAYAGGGKVRNVSYRGVPVDAAECGFSLSHHELDFFDGTVVFNYQDYALRKDFKGPRDGTAKVGRVRYVGASKTVEVEEVAGEIWAAPLVRLFAPKVADALEIYRFHRPPLLKGSGIVDVTPRQRTSLNVSFSSAGSADYRFLGENLTLARPSGKVTIRGPQVKVSDLKMDAFDGPVAAAFEFSGKGRLGGELNWTKLSIPALTSTYGFQMKGGGTVTGRLEFSLPDGDVARMSGEGLLAMENTELFAVPIFGPLSSVISTVVNDRRAGYERAKDAFCTFQIKDGILRTYDFQTATSSLTFAGDGQVNLADRTIDMTMRMNARGLLGLITLPLRPFYGMFQFRGTGPLKDTEWENVMFTAPPEEQRELLQKPPKAVVVPPGN